MDDPTHSSGPVRADLPRLRRLLGAPELGRLVQRLRSRLELGRPLVGSVALAEATEAERAAVERLLGRAPRSGRSLSVPLDAVDRVLRESGACPEGLTAAVVALTGPVASRADAAEQLDRAWEAACLPVAELVDRRPRLSGWWDGVLASGLVRRLLSTPGEAAEVLHDLARILDGLPRPTPQSLPAYAAARTGNSHALDQGPLATLALGAAAALVGAVPGAGAEQRREIWAEAGLLQDPLSSQVLALNLPGDVRTATGRALAALAEAGEPTVLTLRQLAGDRVVMPGSGGVFVCENPAVVVAAADRLGTDSPPLVCLQGQPSIAALRLLRQLTEGGRSLRYHGDFDWGGLRIASRLRDHVPWAPWRYTTADLREALAAHSGTAPLAGAPAPAAWDPELAVTLAHAGRRIEEELLLDLLIDDLASASGR